MEENKTPPTEQNQEQEQEKDEQQKTPEQIAEETNAADREYIDKEIAAPLRAELEKVKTENARLLSLLRGTSRTEDPAPPDYIEEENKRRRENKARQMATFIENK